MIQTDYMIHIFFEIEIFLIEIQCLKKDVSAHKSLVVEVLYPDM